MSENAIDSAKVTPEPAAAKPKSKPGKKAKPANKAGGQEVFRQAEGEPYQQEGGRHRHDEACEGRNAARDHEGNWLAPAHGAWLR